MIFNQRTTAIINKNTPFLHLITSHKIKREIFYKIATSTKLKLDQTRCRIWTRELILYKLFNNRHN